MGDAARVFEAWRKGQAHATVEVHAGVVVGVCAAVWLATVLVQWMGRVEEVVPAWQGSAVRGSVAPADVAQHTQSELEKLQASPEFKRWLEEKNKKEDAACCTALRRWSALLGVGYAALVVWQWADVEALKVCVIACGLQFFLPVLQKSASLAQCAVIALSISVYANLIAEGMDITDRGALVLQVTALLAAAQLLLAAYETWRLAGRDAP